MRNQLQELKLRRLSLAVHAALAAMLAFPATMTVAAENTTDDVAVIRRPTNFIEVGLEKVSDKSAKFGEYNGLNKSDSALITNFSLRGGDAYTDPNGTMRWGLTGRDLGTTSRELSATVGNQGIWNVGIGYDELRHNLTDTYQTPYQGGMGGNAFTIPVGFGAPVSTTAPGTRTLSAGALNAFNTVEVGSTRKNTSLSAGLRLARAWDIKFDFNHLDQSGAKLMSFGQYATGGATGEAVVVLPRPTNYQTNTVNLALNWVGDSGHLTAAYFGSLFSDRDDRVTFQSSMGTGATAVNTQTMSTAPSNQFHQLNLSGGYAFTPVTRLVGTLSTARNTQNDTYAYDAYQMVTASPTSSLNGLVTTTHADLKLTDRSVKALTLTAGYKYDKRDNRTASNIYNFNAISGGNTANYPNTPLSIKKSLFEVGGDVRFDAKQHLLIGLTRENVSRECYQYGVNATYVAGTNCVVAIGSKEDKLSGTYRLKAGDDVNLNVGLATAKRRTDADPYARTAMIGTNGGVSLGLPSSASAGINAGDFAGFRPYFDEDRKQNILKTGVNWQATQGFSLSADARYTNDSYDETYGWKDGHQWSVNLDTAYNFSETGTVNAYVTQQNRWRSRTDKQNNALVTATAARINVPANSTTSGTLQDDDTTVGLGFKQGGLFGNKLELLADLTYSLGKTTYSTTLDYAGATTGGLTCADPSILSCGTLPTIRNSMTQLKLTGNYMLDKVSKVSLGLLHRRLKSDDFYFNGLQYGSTATSMLPTNQQAPSYSVNVVAVSYSYSFK
jgi:MtrB/PioB family decaheme-associated outer membrane protein